MKHRIVCLVFVLFVAGRESHAGGFSKLPISARAVSLGGSLISFADDPNTLFSNPAGIASLNSLSLSTSYTQLFSGITDDQIGYLSASAVANLGFVGNLGIGLKSLSSNTWKENELVGSYAQELFEFLSVGGSVKLLHWSTPPPAGRHAVPEDGMSKVTLSFDVGAQSLIRDIVPENDVRFGIFFGDLTQPSIAKNGSDDGKLDLKMAAGVTYLSRVYDYAVTLHYTVAGDVKRIGVGTEIVAMKSTAFGEPLQVLIRFGGGGVQSPARQGDLNGGVGLVAYGFILDYAFAHQTELLYLTGTHHVSLRYSF
jgi:hypothetical protein